MLRYALYARKSDEDRKVTEKSIGEQVAALRALAGECGLYLAQEFEESKSARRPGVRPRYSAMIQRIEKGQIQGVLCWHINRLVRNMKEGGELAQLLIEGKIQEIRTPAATYRSGDNILPLVLEAATSTQYSLDLARSVTRGMDGHFEAGGVNYKARQGYRNERNPHNQKRGVVVPDGDRFTLMRKAWDMMLTEAYTPAQVIEILNNVWHYRTNQTKKRGGTPLSRAAAYQIFRDPFYAGYVKYRGRMKKGEHPPMVTEEEFAKVQQYLERFSRKGQRCGMREYPFTGLMRCGYCGQQITAERHTLSSGRPYVFYRCSDSRGECTKKGLSEEALERQIRERLESVTINGALCQIALENIVRSLQTKSGDAEAVCAQQDRTLAEIERQRSRLEEMWLRGLMTDAARYRQREQELQERKNRLLLAAERSRNEREAMRQNAGSAADFICHARDGFLVGDLRRRREIAHALGTRYRFFGRERRIEVEVDPLLVEVVKFARQVEDQVERAAEKGPFEPPDTGSGKTKKAPVLEACLSGGTDETGVEAPEVLLDLLRSSHFPLLHLQG